MRLAILFALNQVLSHGIGVFLFAALVPMMRESLAISHWHLAMAGAATQVAYMVGALSLGWVTRWMRTERLILIAGVVTSSLVFSLAYQTSPVAIIATLVCTAATAALSWGAIVEINGRHAPAAQRATYLTTASSGTAWGYGLNGLIILWVLPLLGWQGGWRIAGLVGVLIVLFSWWQLRSLKPIDSAGLALPEGNASLRSLFRILRTDSTAFYSCLVCFVVGFSTMPFANWLNTYLAELNLPAGLAGYTWTLVGVVGMIAGFWTGKLTDRKGPRLVLLCIAVGFALGMSAFVSAPEQYVLLAAAGYGVMYFSMWGVVAGWLNQSFSSTVTMQLSGLGMVTFGLGGALGNLAVGTLYENSGSLMVSFYMLTMGAWLLVLLTAIIYLTRPAASGIDAQPT